ncbi:(2Fe-2S)-binding protein, partial [Actinophytocola sp.]
CCLIYQAPGEQKCVSCPRQHPDDRYRRLRSALG